MLKSVYVQLTGKDSAFVSIPLVPRLLNVPPGIAPTDYVDEAGLEDFMVHLATATWHQLPTQIGSNYVRLVAYHKLQGAKVKGHEFFYKHCNKVRIAVELRNPQSKKWDLHVYIGMGIQHQHEDVRSLVCRTRSSDMLVALLRALYPKSQTEKLFSRRQIVNCIPSNCKTPFQSLTDSLWHNILAECATEDTSDTEDIPIEQPESSEDSQTDTGSDTISNPLESDAKNPVDWEDL